MYPGGFLTVGLFSYHPGYEAAYLVVFTAILSDKAKSRLFHQTIYGNGFGKGDGAVVTGGGSNIGRAITLAFAGEKSNVVIADIDEEQAQKVAKEGNALGSKTIAIKTDITNPDSVAAMVGTALNVNNDRTLWGEMAHQLGGDRLYQMVAKDDEMKTAPAIVRGKVTVRQHLFAPLLAQQQFLFFHVHMRLGHHPLAQNEHHAREHGISLVLKKQALQLSGPETIEQGLQIATTEVLYADEGLDITDAIVERLNAEYQAPVEVKWGGAAPEDNRRGSVALGHGALLGPAGRRAPSARRDLHRPAVRAHRPAGQAGRARHYRGAGKRIPLHRPELERRGGARSRARPRRVRGPASGQPDHRVGRR